MRCLHTSLLKIVIWGTLCLPYARRIGPCRRRVVRLVPLGERRQHGGRRRGVGGRVRRTQSRDFRDFLSKIAIFAPLCAPWVCGHRANRRRAVPYPPRSACGQRGGRLRGATGRMGRSRSRDVRLARSACGMWCSMWALCELACARVLRRVRACGDAGALPRGRAARLRRACARGAAEGCARGAAASACARGAAVCARAREP